MLPDVPRAEAEQHITDWLRFLADRRVRGPRPDGWVYNSPEAFLLAHGRFFEPDLVAFKPRGIPKACFDNAYRVARHKDAKTRYHYVEGVAFRYLPTAHAWLVDQQGRVNDPTWESGAAYFGVELDLKEVARTRRGGWCSLLDDWQRHFPAARGEPVIAPNAWFVTTPKESTDGICSP